MGSTPRTEQRLLIKFATAIRIILAKHVGCESAFYKGISLMDCVLSTGRT